MNLLVYCDIKRLNKVESSKLIRDSASIGLKQAKGFVELMMDGETVLISFPNEDSRKYFESEAERCGLLYRNEDS